MIWDIVGTIGVAIIIATYFMLQTAKLRSDELAYSVLNAVGASMIALSLIFNFNFPALIVEVFWVLISLFGVFKALRRRS